MSKTAKDKVYRATKDILDLDKMKIEKGTLLYRPVVMNGTNVHYHNEAGTHIICRIQYSNYGPLRDIEEVPEEIPEGEGNGIADSWIGGLLKGVIG